MDDLDKSGESTSPDDAHVKPVDWRIVFLPAFLSLIGAFSGSALSFWSTSVTAQNEYSEKFSQIVNDTLPHFKKEDEAGMAFAGLFSLATGERQKRAVIAIGTNAYSPHVRATLAALVGADPVAKRIVNEPAMRALVLSGTDEVINRVMSTKEVDSDLGHYPDDGLLYPDAATFALLQTIAPPESGWVSTRDLRPLGPGDSESKINRAVYVWSFPVLGGERAPAQLFTHVVGMYAEGTVVWPVRSGQRVIYWEHVSLHR